MKVIVIGAGITGVATAEWLRRDGHEVTLIDRIPPGDRRQTSFGNAGILASAAIVPVASPGILPKAIRMVFDPDSPLFLKWSYLPRLLPWLIPFLRNGNARRVGEIAGGLLPLIGDAVDQHMSLAKSTPAERFITLGPYVFLYPDMRAYEADSFAWNLRAKHGLGWDELDRTALVERDPKLSESFRFGCALHNHAWITSPAGYVSALGEHFRQQGGRLVIGELADILPVEDGTAKAVITDGTEYPADRVVLCAGVWSKRIAERLGHRVNMEAERGYHVMLSHPSHKPPTPYMVASKKTAFTPMEDGLRVGGIAEFAGIDPEAHEPPRRFVETQIRTVYPDLEWESETAWMGRRPSTADSLPLIGPSPKVPGVIFAFGGQHLGLTMGARVGRMVADLIAGRQTNIDMRPYRVDRFDRR